MTRSKLSSTIFYLVFFLMPTIWWLVLSAHSGLWASDWYSQVSYWGRLAGISGIGIFAGNIFLSSRHPLIDKWFGGLDEAYTLHRNTGRFAAILLIIHALSMGLRWATTSWTVVANTWFTLPANLDLLLGRTSWLIFIVLVGITLYFKMKYEAKKLLHYWLSLALLLGGLHALLISATFQQSPTLKLYMLAIVVLGLVLFTIRTMLGKWLVPGTKVRVSDVVSLGSKVTQLDLAPRANATFPSYWLPGQFAFVRLKLPQWRYDDHPFTIISQPEEGKVSFAAKAIGDFTNWLPQLPVGTEATIEGPYGGFSYLSASNPYQVWIAGGIGITPFVAMANHFAQNTDRKQYSIQLVYSVTTPEEAVFATKLKEIVDANPNFSLVLWDSSQKGYLTSTWFTPEQIASADFFICGPLSMMNSLERQLLAAKVPSGRIHTERFRLF